MNKNILIVEYDIKTIDIIKESFPYPSIKFKVAEDGLKAKEMLESYEFDMVIAAAMLPKFHGFQLSEYISKKYPHIKIIIISGVYKGVDYKQQAIAQFKADDFFEKPLETNVFNKRVIELLNIDINELTQSTTNTDKNKLIDTAKVPTYQKLKEEEEKLTSNDIFGDIIKDVEKSKPKEEILLDDPIETKKEPKNNIKPKENFKPTPPPQKKMEENDLSRTNRIELDKFNDLMKKPEKKKVVTRIEDDISKKLEDTLSGLGLSSKPVKKKPAPKPAPAPQKDNLSSQIDKINEKKREEKYDILGLIARGGMAEIYKAKKKGVKGFKKVIALKKILTGYGEDDKFIEMFVDEAKIAAELTHPNIVQIYDFEKRDDTYFIAMEYVLGKDLRNILKETAIQDKQIPEEISLYIITKILEALSYAHSAKDDFGNNLDIVHRDVSPPNILISYNGEVKLTDFGVSKASNKMHQTISGALKGKLLYMSPEQAKGDRNIDERADLYSVGVVLFELITGRKLFMDNSEMAVLKKVQEGTLVKPSTIKKDIEPQLENIILKALSKSREDRYQSAHEMIEDLESYISEIYDNSPASVHLSHYIYNLFKDEIIRENIRVELKPVPAVIKKTIKEITPPEKPEIKEEILPEPEQISEEVPSIDLPEFELKLEQSDMIEQEPTQTVEDVQNNQELNETQDLNTSNIGEFSPSIDINLSTEDSLKEEPEIKEPTMTLDEIEKKLQDQQKEKEKQIDLFETQEQKLPEEPIKEPVKKEAIDEMGQKDLFMPDMPEKKSKKPLLIAVVALAAIITVLYFAVTQNWFSGSTGDLSKGPLRLLSNEIELKEGLYYQIGEDTPFTGFVESKLPDNRIKEQTEYLNGKKSGSYKNHFTSGKLKEEGFFLNGKKNSLWKNYNTGGKKISEINYKSGKKNGKVIFWNKNNKIISNMIYKEGKEISGKKFTYFSENNKLKTEKIYKDGVVTNTKRWNLDGDRLIRGTISNKFKQGKLKIGKRTTIKYETDDPEFSILEKGTQGTIMEVDNPSFLLKIKVTKSEKKNAKVTEIANNKKSILLAEENTYIEFVIPKPKPEDKKEIKPTDKKEEKPEDKKEDKPIDKKEDPKTKDIVEKKEVEKDPEEIKRIEEEKRLKAEARKKKKAEEEKKKKEEEEAEKIKAEEEKARLAEEEKKRQEEEEENRRIEQAKQLKLEEEKRKQALKEGDLVSDVDTLPVPIDTTIPKLPKKLRKKIKGNSVQVLVSLLINELGNVRRIKMVKKSGIPELDLEVSRIVLNWKFKPATKYNKKVKTWFSKLVILKK